MKTKSIKKSKYYFPLKLDSSYIVSIFDEYIDRSDEYANKIIEDYYKNIKPIILWCEKNIDERDENSSKMAQTFLCKIETAFYAYLLEASNLLKNSKDFDLSTNEEIELTLSKCRDLYDELKNLYKSFFEELKIQLKFSMP